MRRDITVEFIKRLCFRFPDSCFRVLVMANIGILIVPKVIKELLHALGTHGSN